MDERIGVYRKNHPHWVMKRAKYALTFLCHGAIPYGKKLTLRQQRDISGFDNEDEWKRFFEWDEWIEKSEENRFFKSVKVREKMNHFMHQYDDGVLKFRHWVIMPNHLHAITEEISFQTIEEFKQIWKLFKGRSAIYCNGILNRKGPFWKIDQFDRWIRNDYEETCWIDYIKKNPVKAGLVKRSEDWVGLHFTQPR